MKKEKLDQLLDACEAWVKSIKDKAQAKPIHDVPELTYNIQRIERSLASTDARIKP